MTLLFGKDLVVSLEDLEAIPLEPLMDGLHHMAGREFSSFQWNVYIFEVNWDIFMKFRLMWINILSYLEPKKCKIIEKSEKFQVKQKGNSYGWLFNSIIYWSLFSSQWPHMVENECVVLYALCCLDFVSMVYFFISIDWFRHK